MGTSGERVESQSTKTIEVGPGSKEPFVFISHDADDAELAEAFGKLLGNVSAGVLKTFRSSDKKGREGIEYGQEWYQKVMSKLESASDVVCLLTQRSVDRPWILYEAGVAKGKLNTTVFGVAFGIPLSRANTGPFAQFQNCGDDVDSLTKLVKQLLRRIQGADPDAIHDAIQMQVTSFKEKASKILGKITEENQEKGKVGVRGDVSTAKLFEEIKVMFQDLPGRIEQRVVEGPTRVRRFRFHPMMLEELMHYDEDAKDPIGLLLLSSMVRDYLPWLSEPLLEVYRALKSGDAKRVDEAMVTISNLSRLGRSPLMEEFGMRSMDFEILAHELPMMLDRYIGRYRHRVERPTRQKSEAKKQA